MTTHLTAKYETLNWQEQTYAEQAEGHKITQVTAKGVFTGELEATGQVAYLLTYVGTGCEFIGYEQVTGTLAGRAGSFVLQYLGSTTETGGLQATATVVPGSGRDGLAGLRGTGGYVWNAQEGQLAEFTLDYELAG